MALGLDTELTVLATGLIVALAPFVAGSARPGRENLTAAAVR